MYEAENSCNRKNSALACPLLAGFCVGSTLRGTLLQRTRVISFYKYDCFVMGNTALSLNYKLCPRSCQCFVMGNTALGLNYKFCPRSCQCFRFLPLINFCFLIRDENLYRVENRVASCVSDFTVNILRKSFDST
jgi:hypothetical protein